MQKHESYAFQSQTYFYILFSHLMIVTNCKSDFITFNSLNQGFSLDSLDLVIHNVDIVLA